jgi:CDP-2,3-bis-(O-geranylgeranyl)-sn-glycerol synthase
MTEIKLLILLGLANGAPIIASKLLGERFRWPIDANLKLRDHFPLFGPSKTIRGFVAAVATTSIVAPLLGFSWRLGALIALFAMLGDLFSSFVKRRLGMPSSTMVLGLDQIPESLFPMLLCRPMLGLSWSSMCLIVVLFIFSELLFSRILYRLQIRNRPY